MSLDTWISLVVLVTALSGLYFALRRELRSELASEIGGVRAELRNTRDELRTEIGGVRAELQGTRDELRTEIREEGARLEGLILRLDDRVYALAAGMRLPEARATPPRAAQQ